MTTLTDTQVLDLIETHKLEVAHSGDTVTHLKLDPYWRVWTKDSGGYSPSTAPTLRAALILAHGAVVAHKLVE